LTENAGQENEVRFSSLMPSENPD